VYWQYAISFVVMLGEQSPLQFDDAVLKSTLLKRRGGINVSFLLLFSIATRSSAPIAFNISCAI